MNTSTPLSDTPRGCHRPFPAWFMLAVTLVAGFAPASTAAANRSATPPAFRDSMHVMRGCYLSTVAYLARFTAEYPAESARPLTIAPRNFDGPHTIAVLTWKGRWWGRDEYSGVFPLDIAVAPTIDVARLRHAAATRLGRLASRQLKSGRIVAGSDAVAAMSTPAREREIARAATLIPSATTVVRVRSDGSDVPFLFFQPTAGRIAVYDPATGTATADGAPTDVTALVTQIAARLGYRVDGFRGTLVRN